MNKSLITNIIAILAIGVGFLDFTWASNFYYAGIFALSGAITNWIAIYMLFDRVPFVYGSGVIPLQFEKFKAGIHALVMEQFFNRENIQKFLNSEEESPALFLDITPVLDQINYDRLFEKLVEAIMESSFGSMLGMFGGKEALDPLKAPFSEKIRNGLVELSQDEGFSRALQESLNNKQIGDDWIEYIEQIVEKRLDELTPQMVKEIIQQMIHEHLGWLVVWGGVFGGLIGVVASFIKL
jgi:uncharacterized membrane-anchored protein YjiN (DUF445 family)